MNESRIQHLERVIAHLDTLYEVGKDCIHPDTGVLVSDGEYDSYRRELKNLSHNSTVFSTPTASTPTASKAKSSVGKVKHKPPMTSIEKASHEDRSTQEGMLFKWLRDCQEEIPGQGKEFHLKDKIYQNETVSYPDGYFYQAYKLDGVALAIYYEKGYLVKAGLRPRDGINGEDVTEQVKYVDGIPERLKLPLTASFRGELICRLSDFEKIQKELKAAGDDLRANPRNHAAGGIRQFKNPAKVKKQRLSFIAYAIEGLDNSQYETEIERAIWCNKEVGIPFVQVRKFNFYDLQKMEDSAKDLDYEVDGVIVGVNNLEDQEQLGRHGDTPTGNPRGKIAWKFAEEVATPVIKNIAWQTGRSGKIVPVAEFKAVPLAGTQVSRATLHNAGFIKRNEIVVGSKIKVLKAGKIIPKVVGIVSGKGNPQFPEKCPACAGKTELEKGNEDMLELVCTNSDCSAKSIRGLCHYLTTFGVMGLGENRVAQLVEGGAIKNFADFYRLDVSKIVSCGLSERQALLMLGGIHMVNSPEKLEDDELKKELAKAIKAKKEIPLWQLFASFGIKSAGKSAGKALIEHFDDFAAIRNASVDELAAVEDIGEKTAELIHDYLHKHESLIDNLLKYIEPLLPKRGKLTGKKFCFSGGFPDGKRTWEEKVENEGGVCSGSVGRKTDYLVAGDGSGSKSDKAKELGVPIINIKQLEALL